jgi:hypothetical protein
MFAKARTSNLVFLVVLSATTASISQAASTLAPLGTFGGGDGWRAPFEVLASDAAGTNVPGDDTNPAYLYLGNTVQNTGTAVNGGNLERGLGYNPVTGNLYVVSRNDAGNTRPSVRVIDGATGVDEGFLDQGTGIVTGGLFVRNMIGVADDGAIYMANLATTISGSSPYKVYRWANEASTPTVAYSGTGAGDGVIAGARLGDSFDVFGSGTGTKLVAGYARNTAIAGTNGFSLFSTGDGATFTGQQISIGGSPTTDSGDFRLGITFTDADTILGKQGDPNIPGVVDPSAVRVVDVAGTTGTLTNSFSTDGATLRAMDYAVVDGTPIMAILECSGAQDAVARARIFIYNMTDLSAPIAERKLQEGSTLPDPGPGISPKQFPNGNGVGSVKFGQISGNVATIYAMSTNNGIEAFQFTLDLPVPNNADFDDDGTVDGNDLLAWQRGLGNTSETGKANGNANTDTVVDAADLAIWQSKFGGPPATAAVGAVPEPCSALLALAGLAILGRRRR